MKKASEDLVRLKRVLLNDSLQLPSGVIGVLKSDVCAVLGGYFDLDGEVSVSIAINENGVYSIRIDAVGKDVKRVKAL